MDVSPNSVSLLVNVIDDALVGIVDLSAPVVSSFSDGFEEEFFAFLFAPIEVESRA